MESPWAPGLFWFPPPSPRVNTNPAPQPPTSHGAVPPPRAQPQRGAGQWPPCAGPDTQRGGPAAAKGRRPRTGFCLTRKTQNQKGGGVCGFGPTPGHVYRRKAPETFREMSSHGRIYFGGSPPLLLGVPRRAGWGEASSPTGLGKWPAPVPSTDPRPAPTPDRASLSGLPFAG